MATHYGDFRGAGTATSSAYPISYSGAGIINISPLAEEMIRLLPSYYCLGENVRKIMELIATVLQEYSDDIEDLQKQMFVCTATWGLVFWEQMVGLPPDPTNTDYASRCASVIAKLNECSSEKCFKDGLEAVIGGTVVIIDLDPTTNPYQLDIELGTSAVTFVGPSSAPVVSLGSPGALTGDYTYKITYGFVPINLPNYISVTPASTGETSSGISPVRTNEVQTLTATGTVTAGTFTVTFDDVTDFAFPPNPRITDPVPWDATSGQIKAAIESLPNVSVNSLIVSGGPTHINPVNVEFTGNLSGFPQNSLTINSSGLVGGTYDSSLSQAGATSYGDSESNTITATADQILLTNIPVSPEGAIRRSVYRKKNAAPYNEYRLVGTIEDNVTTVFTDNVPDEELSESQVVVVGGTGSLKLRFDSVDTSILTASSTAVDVKAALEVISTVAYPIVGVTVTGTSFASGYTVVFDGGDTAGKDVPLMDVVDTGGGITSTSVVSTGPASLTGKNSAYTTTFQRAVNYIYETKPAHIRVRELRGLAFRASINSAGDPV